MVRTQIALVSYVVIMLLIFGLRVLLQRLRYGDSGWRLHRASRTGAVAQRLMVTSGVLLLVAPIAALVAGSTHEPLGPVRLTAPGSTPAWLSAGLASTAILAGVVTTLWAQEQMGASWRVGVDARERTSLVTQGLFRWVRNPIFTGTGLVWIGEALLVPNAFAVAAVVLGVVGLQVQVRLVEEPYLRRTHGEAYLDWAATSGRFLPGFGRL
jgi:protein-S-isoprenylcysteine O-methyltransferase Ste14